MNHLDIKLYIIIFGILISFSSCAQNSRENNKVTKSNKTYPEGYEKATLAGGCFWCVEAVFERVEGVHDAISGYSGGKENNPTYNAVAAGKTSHAEAVEIYYDPEKISYAKILEIFFATHDPTTLNRQGPDVGPQYRSSVFYHNDRQKEIAQEVIQELERKKAFKNPVVTEVVPFEKFFTAEDYHQDYYELNPDNPYIINVTRPKILKFEKEYKDVLKSASTTRNN